jgi:hypothetical protein
VLFVLGNGAIFVLVVLIIPKYPKHVSVVPEGLNEGTFACLGSLGAHRLCP